MPSPHPWLPRRIGGHLRDPLLERRLGQPMLQESLPTLLGLWRTVRQDWVCRVPPGLEDGPWLGGAIRGAIGHRLLAQAMDGPPSGARDGGRIPTYSVFYRTHAIHGVRMAVPVPWALAVERRGGLLHLSITVFGFAVYWEPDLRQAVAEALHGGIALKPLGAIRAPFPVQDMTLCVEDSFRPAFEMGRSAMIVMRSPLILKRGPALKGRIEDFLPSLADRIAGLARWQDIRLPFDRDELKALGRSVPILDAELTPVAWLRRSGRQGGREIPVAGYMGRFTLGHIPWPFDLMLPLGPQVHTGAGAAFGLGRFDVLP